MSNIVFILGAGASRQCGGPLIADFLDVASDLLDLKAVEEKRAAFETVFAARGALQRVHSKAQLDLNNIESIFTALELGRIIQKVPGLTPEQIPQAIAALKELIVTTLEVRMVFPVKDRDIIAPKLYAAFADLLQYLRRDAVPAKTSAVITFNYDIAVDIAMFRAGLGPDYIIEKQHSERVQVPLLKLHGSLNWATEKVTRNIYPLHLSNYFQKYQVNPSAGGPKVGCPLGRNS